MEKSTGVKPFGRINIIDPQSLAQEFARYESGNCHVVRLSNNAFFIEAFDTKPADGYLLPDNFPDCCPGHRRLFKSLKKDLNKFPDCCPLHRNLFKAPWFDKTNYLHTPLKTLQALAYTLNWIEININKRDWYKKIYDYIEHTIRSYGQLPAGFGGPVGLNWYTSLVNANIPLIKNLPAEKLSQLLSITGKINGVKEKAKETDLDQLIGIYQAWKRIFPFELPYLNHIKPHFDKIIPIMKGPGETNSYTGITAYNLTSKKELLKFLTEITEYIITELSASNLFDSGKLTLTEQTELKLLTANRRLEIEDLRITTNADAKVFLKLLRQWLLGEEVFIARLREKLQPIADNESFAQSICDGIRQIQQNDTNERCLLNIRQNGPDRESSVRYWFRNFLVARYPKSVIPAEEQNGPGRMDLKFYQQGMKQKILEFKGWWNFDKKTVPRQLIGYLTDFEGEGYIIMINHLQADITEKYMTLVTRAEMGYQEGSWIIHQVQNSSFVYFSSIHLLGPKPKKLYHFILNAYF